MKCFKFDRYTIDWDPLDPAGSKWSTPRECVFPFAGDTRHYLSQIETSGYAKSWTGSNLNDCQQFEVWSIPIDARYQAPYHEGASQKAAWSGDWLWGWCQGLIPGHDAVYHYRGEPTRSGATWSYNHILIYKILPITPNATRYTYGVFDSDPRTAITYEGNQPSWQLDGVGITLDTLDRIPAKEYHWRTAPISGDLKSGDISHMSFPELYRAQAYAWTMYRNAEGALWRRALQTFKLHDTNLCTNLIDTFSGKRLATSILDQLDMTLQSVWAIKGPITEYMKVTDPAKYWSGFLHLITSLRDGGKGLAKTLASAQLLKSYGILLPAKGLISDINSQQPWVVSAQTVLEFTKYVIETITSPGTGTNADSLNGVQRNLDMLASKLEAAYTPQIRSRMDIGGVTCSISAECTFDESQIAKNYVRQLHRVGILPTFEGLWDLVPLSFVIDWVSGVIKRVAQTLDSSILAAECSTKHYCRSIKVEGSSKFGYGYKVYQRSYSERAPWVGLSIQDFAPGFRIDYLPEGASLLISSL